jgi:hypothetical protein
MKRWLGCLLGIAGIGCSSSAFAMWNAFPRELLRQGLACPTNKTVQAKGLQLLATQRWSDGIVALYSATCPDPRKHSNQPVFAYKVMQRDKMNWFVRGSDGYAVTGKPKSTQRLVQFRVSRSGNVEGDRHTVLYGQVFSPKVTAIEASFDNGQVLRGDSSNGVFALVAPKASGVCEVRVIGIDNQILQVQERLVVDQFARTQRSRACPPVSQEL